MCVAVPMRVDSVEGRRGVVSSSGVELEVGLDLVDEVAVGDYVIVHAGFAIQVLPEDEARERLAIFARLAESWEG